MKKKVVIAGVVVAVIAVAAGISAMRKKPVEEEALIPVVNVENPQMEVLNCTAAWWAR